MTEYTDDEWAPGEEFRGDQISVFSGGLLGPIGSLIERLVEAPPRSRPDTVGEREYGHCIAIISLLFLAFESFVGRAGHLRRIKTHADRDAREHAHTTEFLKVLAPDFSEELLFDLDEAYVLRDATAHAHIWTTEYVVRKTGTEVTEIEKHPGYGNKRHRNMVDVSTGRTTRRGLRAIPTNIGLQEVLAVFRTLRAVLHHLVATDALEIAAIQRGIRYRTHRHFQFWALDVEIENLIAQRHKQWAISTLPGDPT